MKEIIKLEQVSKVYGAGNTTVYALDNVNFLANEGEFISVMGPSGSGKTTLLNMIGALDKPTLGRVLIDGQNISSLPERKLYLIRRNKIGFIFQNYYLIPTLTALENVLVPLLPVRRGKEIINKAKNLLELVGLEHRINHRPKALSGGESQRVAIARALISDPKIILADEPTGNLDSKKGKEILNLMKQINQEQKKTFIIVTHDPEIVKETQKVFIMKDGKIVKEGTGELADHLEEKGYGWIES